MKSELISRLVSAYHSMEISKPDTASYWISVEHLADRIATRSYATS
ncbi:hypothetical protein ACGFIW_26030 [Micromonospora sp. NPDC048935]